MCRAEKRRKDASLALGRVVLFFLATLVSLSSTFSFKSLHTRLSHKHSTTFVPESCRKSARFVNMKSSIVPSAEAMKQVER